MTKLPESFMLIDGISYMHVEPSLDVVDINRAIKAGFTVFTEAKDQYVIATKEEISPEVVALIDNDMKDYAVSGEDTNGAYNCPDANEQIYYLKEKNEITKEQQFGIQPHTTVDKYFTVYAPSDVELNVDYDDVNHQVVDVVVETMVDILNEHWDAERMRPKLRELAEKHYRTMVDDEPDLEGPDGEFGGFEDYWNQYYEWRFEKS